MSALAIVVGAGSGLAGGLLVPALIARIPEPVPEDGAADRTEHEQPPDAGSSHPEPGHGDSAAGETRPQAVAPGTSGPQQSTPRAAPRGLPPAPPKETYAHIAALPGLGWRSATASAAIGALLGWSLGWSWSLLVWLPLVPIGVALAVVDWRTTLLPTRVIAPAYALVILTTLAVAAVEGDWQVVTGAAIGWAVMGGAFLALWLIYPRGLGYGDVRLSGVLGIALGQLGWVVLLTGMYAGFLIGGLGGLLLAALRVVDRRRFPFGPFLLLGALTGVLAGPTLAQALGS